MSDRGVPDRVRRLAAGGRRMFQEVAVQRENDAYGQGFGDAADACLRVVDRHKRELEDCLEAGTLAKHQQALVPALTKLRDAMQTELRELKQSQTGMGMAFEGDVLGDS